MQYVDPHLPREIFGWHSPRLGLHMPIVRYGRKGRPLLMLPSAQSDYLEYERFFVIKTMEPLIFQGRLQVFSIDSINKYSWMNEEVPIPEKVRRQQLYAGYIEEEVIPHVRRAVGQPNARAMVSGVSFGAFHAANQFFRRPDLFDVLIGLSGFYDLTNYLEGQGGEASFFHNPSWYLRSLEEPNVLHTLRNHAQIHLVSGQGSWERPEKTTRFSELLWSKGIPNNCDLWGHDVAHDWLWWRRMYEHYLNHRVGI